MRVRLELDPAFFLKQEDGLAREHFERVLASTPEPAVAANVRRFLRAIRKRKRWLLEAETERSLLASARCPSRGGARDFDEFRNRRDWTPFGFSPRISVARERRESNTQGADYKRTGANLERRAALPTPRLIAAGCV